MSLATRLSDFATAVGTAIKASKMLINGNAADLSALNTTVKTSLLAAINEVNAKPSGGAAINDASTNSLTETYSINKITDVAITEASQAAADMKAEILGSVSAAQDTLEEIKVYVDSGQAVDLTALANRLRVDAAQGLTNPQKQFGRDNLSVYSQAEIGNPETDIAAVFAAALV